MSRARKAIVFLEQNWKEGDSLKEVAKKFDVDQGDLSRDFHKTYGISPKAYINGKRMAYVKERIGRNGLFGYELADELGFPSDASFYRWLKRATGMSFSVFRRIAHDKK